MSVEAKRSERITDNFHKRFGDRIEMVFLDKPLEPTEQKIRDVKILKAYTLLLTEILKREPTPEELLGIVKIKPRIKLPKT